MGTQQVQFQKHFQQNPLLFLKHVFLFFYLAEEIMRVGKYVLQLKMNASAPSKNVQNYRIIWRCHECDDDYDGMEKECELAVGYIKEKS